MYGAHAGRKLVATLRQPPQCGITGMVGTPDSGPLTLTHSTHLSCQLLKSKSFVSLRFDQIHTE